MGMIRVDLKQKDGQPFQILINSDCIACVRPVPQGPGSLIFERGRDDAWEVVDTFEEVERKIDEAGRGSHIRHRLRFIQQRLAMLSSIVEQEINEQ